MVLERLVDFLEGAQELKETVTSAMLYPLLLSGFCVLIIVIFLTVIIPMFSAMFEDVGEKVPASAQFLLGLSASIKGY